MELVLDEPSRQEPLRKEMPVKGRVFVVIKPEFAYHEAMWTRTSKSFQNFLHQPAKVFFVAASVTFFLVILNGSLWRFWSLQRNQEKMVSRIMDIQEKSRRLEFEIHEADKLTYIERQATDQFDYVREGDLIFVFAE